MGLAVRDNLDEMFGQLESAFDGVSTIAIPRALNELRDQARVAGFRKIRSVYQLSEGDLAAFTSLRTATSRDLEAAITVKGRGFPLSAFKPKEVKGGISVLIKGKRVLVPHAFFTPRTGQRVFARGAYGGKGLTSTTGQFGRFTFGRGRRITKPRAERTELPINQLYSFAPPDTLANQDVVDVMNDRVEEQASKVLAREIKAVQRGF